MVENHIPHPRLYSHSRWREVGRLLSVVVAMASQNKKSKVESFCRFLPNTKELSHRHRWNGWRRAKLKRNETRVERRKRQKGGKRKGKKKIWMDRQEQQELAFVYSTIRKVRSQRERRESRGRGGWFRPADFARVVDRNTRLGMKGSQSSAWLSCQTYIACSALVVSSLRTIEKIR